MVSFYSSRGSHDSESMMAVAGREGRRWGSWNQSGEERRTNEEGDHVRILGLVGPEELHGPFPVAISEVLCEDGLHLIPRPHNLPP